VPGDVALKDPKDFKLIGTPLKRLDNTRTRSTGPRGFGIDVRLPGMKSPRWRHVRCSGASLPASDDAKAKALPGVQQVVRLDDAVAVVAAETWRKARLLGRRATFVGMKGRTRTLSTANRAAVGNGGRRRQACRPQAGRRRRAMAGAAQKVRGDLRAAVPGARHHGAGELHRSRSSLNAATLWGWEPRYRPSPRTPRRK